jgi:carboxyl-terminal processing protease
VDPDIELPSHINAELIGESVRESALPWDTVPTTRFRAGKSLDVAIQSLAGSYEERAKSDPNFRYQVDMVRAAEALSEQKTVSLNIDKRREEREAELQRRLDRENERRKALGLEPVASLDDIDEDDVPDILLDQAAGIVTDLATLREIDIAEPTAQLQPVD